MSGSPIADSLLKMKPKTKRGEATLAKLIEVAEELFAEKNYYEASVSEIVSRAGMSIGAFYVYFNDKLSLYKYMVMQYGRRLRKRISMELSKKKHLTTRYELEREGMKIFLDFCIERPYTFPIVWQSLFVAPELFIDYYDDFGKNYEKQLGEAVRSGEIYPANLEVLSYMLMGISNFLALKYVKFGPPQPLDDEQLYRIVDEMMLVLSRGMFIQSPEKTKEK